jgi:hypothetical protein
MNRGYSKVTEKTVSSHLCPWDMDEIQFPPLDTETIMRGLLPEVQREHENIQAFGSELEDWMWQQEQMQIYDRYQPPLLSLMQRINARCK